MQESMIIHVVGAEKPVRRPGEVPEWYEKAMKGN